MPPAKLDPVGAREALAAVDAVRTRAGAVPGATTPWALLLPTGVLVGVSIFLIMMDSLWGFATLLLACVLCVVAAARSRDRRTRFAVKQPVRNDPPTHWASIVPVFLVYPMMVLFPKGDPVLAAIAGAVVAAMFIYLARITENQ